MRRAALVIATVAALFATHPAAAGMNDAALTEAAATLAPNRYVWTDTRADGPVSILVSLPDQRAYVFRGEKMIAASTVSTGREGNETPVGSFTILQKAERHFSNLYDAAPMPYMQRLTWDGVAMHAGANPGFPASHGCIRLPAAFARKLFAITALGATVEVTDMAYIAGDRPMRGQDEMAAANALSRDVTEAELTDALAAR